VNKVRRHGKYCLESGHGSKEAGDVICVSGAGAFTSNSG
jgi:hypothetical protein